MICLHRELENPKPCARSTGKSAAHLQEDDLFAEARQSLDSSQCHVERVARLVLRANAMRDPLAPLCSLASRPAARPPHLPSDLVGPNPIGTATVRLSFPRLFLPLR